jgi:mannitol-specific phosphotransferase system IIBC component
MFGTKLNVVVMYAGQQTEHILKFHRELERRFLCGYYFLTNKFVKSLISFVIILYKYLKNGSYQNVVVYV